MSDKEFNPDPGFTAWGPLIRHPYIVQPVLYSDIVIASIVFGVAMLFGLLAAYMAVQQTRAARRPLRSAYIWMIWLELAACVVIGIECLLFLLKVIRPSFYFYMSILLNWSIQVQLLLQIIINRIRVILSNRKQGIRILIAVAVIVTLINISVFCIWMPARLEISQRWIDINNVWDRIEKVLYLLIDGALNWYFIHVVRANLTKNGLEKYNRLVRFNQRIIIISLLMDVMIIAAMWIPNGFVYAIFHPLAYLVKLNIEMSMANLIKKIALENRNPRSSQALTFASESADGSSATNTTASHQRKGSFWANNRRLPKTPSMQENGIWKTEDYCVRSDPRTSHAEALEMVWDPTNDKRPGSSGCYSGDEAIADIESMSRLSEDTSLPSNEVRREGNWLEDEDVLVKPRSALKKRRTEFTKPTFLHRKGVMPRTITAVRSEPYEDETDQSNHGH